ncbi:MAG: VOC family protein [Chromatiales bacterium]
MKLPINLDVDDPGCRVLCQCHRASPWASSFRRYRRHWTPVHLDFVVDDVWAAVQRALNAGAKLEGEVQCHPWGYLGTMSDPFGHGFCYSS